MSRFVDGFRACGLGFWLFLVMFGMSGNVAAQTIPAQILSSPPRTDLGPNPLFPGYQNYPSNACDVPAQYGATAAEVGKRYIAAHNAVTGGVCGQLCTNPATFISANETAKTFVIRSNCSGTSGTITLTAVAQPKSSPADNCCEANPVNASTGGKYQVETDYRAPGAGGVVFARYYNSNALDGLASIGTPRAPKWRTTYAKQITKITPSGQPTLAMMRRHNGQILTFTRSGSAWIADTDVPGKLEDEGSGWKYVESANVTEHFDAQGRLTSIVAGGLTTTLTYNTNAKLPAQVTDAAGRTLTFTYDTSMRLTGMTDPAGGNYVYGYTGNNLTSVQYPDGKTRTYHYEEPGQLYALTGITDENNVRFATWDYDASGRVILSKHAGDVDQHTFTYGTGSALITDALGTQRTYTLQLDHGVLKPQGLSGERCANCGSKAAAYTYDTNGYVASETDFDGNVTTYVHNALGLEESRTEAYGTLLARTITTQWHATFRLPTQIDEPGRRSVYTYDATTGDRLTQTVTDLATSESRAMTWTYTTGGRVQTVDGPRTDVSDVTTYAYYTCTTGGQCGQVHTITNALSQVTEVTSYNAHGNPLTIVDPNGVTTTLTYDARQRLKTRTIAGSTTTFDYDGVGQLDKVTMPDGSFLDYTYDPAHRLTDIQDNAGNKVHFTLDLAGNRTAEEVFDPASALKRKRSQVFNSLGRLLEIKNAAGQTVMGYAYDHEGNRTTETAYDDPSLSFQTVNEFDALNRMWRSTAPDGGVTQYGYNARDQLTGVTDPKSLITTYGVNALGDVQELGSPDSGVTGYEYDAAGNRTSQTDARGVPVAYSHDALNRLTFVDYPGTAEDVTYTYDSATQSYGKGRLTGIQDASGTTTLIYDAHGNVTSEAHVIGGSTYATGYTYDSADRVASITHPTGRLVTYVRNGQGQVTSVTTTVGGNTTTVAQDIAYMPFGGVKSYALGNGVVVARTYDTDYRLQGVTDSGSATVQNLDFDYDRRGNITVRDDLVATVTQSFAYDEISRLTSATGAYGTQGFTYDDVGNRLTQTGTTSDTYDYVAGSHHLSSLGSGTNFGYDDAGNVTSKGGLGLTYNSANRMATASVGGVTVTNTYGASGQRIKKLASGITTVFSYDRSGQLIAEQPDAGSAREYVWLGDIPLAQASAAGLAYFHVDQLNTPQKMSDGSQAVVWQASYTPFGEATVTASGGYDNPLRFPGQYFDVETGLHQNWRREYDPSLGRYLQSDPIGLLGGISTYAYVVNNPLRFADPRGLSPGQPSPVTALETAVLEGDVAATEMLAEAAGIPVQQAEALLARAAANGNKIKHVFGQARHKLDGLVEACGSEGRALKELSDAGAQAFPKIEGVAQEIQVTIRGMEVTVRGIRIDGIFQLSTAFVP